MKVEVEVEVVEVVPEGAVGFLYLGLNDLAKHYTPRPRHHVAHLLRISSVSIAYEQRMQSSSASSAFLSMR